MAKRGSSSGFSSGGSLSSAAASGKTVSPQNYQINDAPQIQVASAQAAQAANASVFSDTDNAPYHQLYNGRNYFNQQKFDIDARMAITDYLDPTPTAGSLYNASQNMNYAIQNGLKLTAQQQFMYDSMVDAMHNMGYNVNLTRYDHGEYLDNLLKSAGATKNHGAYSIAQMKKALVGHSYTDKRILSTSYNDFAQAGSSAQTFTSREVKIVYQTPAGAQVLMPGNGAGGRLGEICLAPSGTKGRNNYTILDVRKSGNKARAKGASASNRNLDQIEIVVQVS